MNVFGRRHDDAPTPSHAPREEPVNTLTVTCAQSGVFDDIEGSEARCPTLADIEAWCTDLRRHGAPGGLLLEDASNCLAVTLNVSQS